MKWIDVKDELPAYGIPVLLKANGVVQHVTYMLDGSDDEADWFEPFYFDHGGNCKVRWDKANAWQYLPE